jgi:thymidylate kinase
MNLNHVSASFVPHRFAGRLLIVEGLPGAGKTSAIARICHLTDSIVLPELDHVVEAPDRDNCEWAKLQRWYVERERARQAALNSLLRQGRSVIQDRCVLSTLAFAYAESKECSVERTKQTAALLAGAPRFTLPDTLLLMYVDIEVSLQRRESFRGSTTYKPWFDRQFLQRLDEYYRVVVPRLLPCPTIEIDTTLASPSAVAALVENVFAGIHVRVEPTT